MYASKLVYNDKNNWRNIAGRAQCGVPVVDELQVVLYKFGLEEWMNNPILLNAQLGYLDSYRSNNFTGVTNRIVLFCFNPNTGIISHVGNVYNVIQLQNDEISEAREMLNSQNWLSIVETDFHRIGDTRSIENINSYMECWNSNIVVGRRTRTFIVNIKYERLEIFPDERPLTGLILGLNGTWKRLRQRYNVPMEWERYFIEQNP